MTDVSELFEEAVIALSRVTDHLAKDPRTQRDDEQWSVFSQCVAALAKFPRRAKLVRTIGNA
jgi:hypothetical protein